MEKAVRSPISRRVITGRSQEERRLVDPEQGSGLRPGHAEEHVQEEQMPLNAADIMTRDVVSARPEDPVIKVAKLLSDRGISAVPVCDEQGGLLGMLSEGDLMRPFGQEHALRRDWWLDLLADGTDLAPAFLDYVRVDNRRARDLMVTPVITAPDDATVPALADLLGHHQIKRVPIMHDGKLVGIVSRADVLRALAQAPSVATKPI
jgi:CBS domain-containing protein